MKKIAGIAMIAIVTTGATIDGPGVAMTERALGRAVEAKRDTSAEIIVRARTPRERRDAEILHTKLSLHSPTIRQMSPTKLDSTLDRVPRKG